MTDNNKLHLISHHPATDDKLDFEHYTYIIYDIPTSMQADQTGLTVGIFGDWGSGKNPNLTVPMAILIGLSFKALRDKPIIADQFRTEFAELLPHIGQILPIIVLIVDHDHAPANQIVTVLEAIEHFGTEPARTIALNSKNVPSAFAIAADRAVIGCAVVGHDNQFWLKLIKYISASTIYTLSDTDRIEALNLLQGYIRMSKS